MKLEWIEDILAVHDTGSLRAAAEVRFLTASAFTRRIKAVENAIGSELFDRSSKPVTLRPHVVELIPGMREVSASLRVLRNELGGFGDINRITRLTCQHTLSVSWAPRVVRALAQNNAQVRIRSAGKDECLFSVLNNNTDIALVYEEIDLVINQEEDLFDRIHLAKEEFLPVVALKGNDELARAINNSKFPLISYPRNIFLGAALEKALSKNLNQNFSFITVAESGLGPAVMEFVREGLGVGWIPSSLIKKEIDNGEFSPMTKYVPSFSLNIVALSSKSSKSRNKLDILQTIEAEFGAKTDEFRNARMLV